MDIAHFEREAETFSRAISRETYLQRAGLKDQLDLDAIYERHQHLFTLESFHELGAAGLEAKYQRFLQNFVAQHVIEAQVKQYNERLAESEATATIEWEDETLTYRAAPVRWANLGNQDRRHALYQRWLEQTAAMNPLRRERHQASLQQPRELGFADYVQLWDHLRGLHLDDLNRKMTGLLEQTRALYQDELRAQLLHARVNAGEAWKVDLAWVFRAPRYDQYFNRERLLPTLFRTLADLGIRLEEQPNIKLDTEYRPKKSPRAFCAPLEIPDDVRLIVMPTGGRTDYDSLLHEAGHAEHFGNVDRTQPFAYRWLGDNSVTEAYAFLFQYLTTDKLWLASQLELTSPTDYLRTSLFNKLYMLRRYGTKVLYEQQLHRAEEEQGMSDLYAELFTDNLGARYFEDEYLSDVDNAFYSAQYLRAWTLETQLRQYLKREFDEEWFRVPKAGRFLVDLWREGQKYTAEELAGFMGYDGLDMTPMLDEFRAALSA